MSYSDLEYEILSRQFILQNFTRKFSNKRKEKNNFIDGEFEDIEENDERKL